MTENNGYIEWLNKLLVEHDKRTTRAKRNKQMRHLGERALYGTAFLFVAYWLLVATAITWSVFASVEETVLDIFDAAATSLILMPAIALTYVLTDVMLWFCGCTVRKVRHH